MTEEPAHMWTWWRNKKGYGEALKDYFPQTLAANPELQIALFQIKSAQAMVDQFFAERGGDDVL